MESANKKGYISEKQITKLIRLINGHGKVSIATINGGICAASVWYRVGRRNFMHIIAHDPNFDDFKLGHLLQAYTFKQCVRLGSTECWMMAGGEYKQRFGARKVGLESVYIYRNRYRSIVAIPAFITTQKWKSFRRLVQRLKAKALICLRRRVIPAAVK